MATTTTLGPKFSEGPASVTFDEIVPLLDHSQRSAKKMSPQISAEKR